MKYRQIAMLIGPRQAGKTWIAKHLGDSVRYLSWDDPGHRRMILENGPALLERAGLNRLTDQKPIIVFDELHKYRLWKDFLKGFFDSWEDRCSILVTGSTALDAFSRGGDSLMGRYFPLRCHPLTWVEILADQTFLVEHTEESAWLALQEFGGFPEPFLRQDPAFWRRWKNLRWKQLFREDLRDLTRSLELDRIELLGTILLEQAAGLCKWSSLANRLHVSQDTLRRWVSHLETLYTIFLLKPWSRNVSRSLLKEPKVYFTDWSWPKDPGARAENFMAGQLRATIHLWQDQGLGEFDLWFLRDKDGSEADFLVSRDDRPWLLLEVKKSDTHFSPGFLRMVRKVSAPHNFQLVLDLPIVQANPFAQGPDPLAVPARSFFRDWKIQG